MSMQNLVAGVISAVFFVGAHVLAFYGAYLLHPGVVALVGAVVCWRFGVAFGQAASGK